MRGPLERRPHTSEERAGSWRLGAIALACVAVAATALGVALRLSPATAPVDAPPLYLQDVAAGLLFPLLALVVLVRQPRNRIGWLLLAMGTFGGLAVLSAEYVAAGVLGPSAPLPGLAGMAAVATGSWFPFIGLVPLFLLWLPEGSLPSRRWAPIAWGVATLNLVIVAQFGYFGAIEGPALVLSDVAPEGLANVVFAVMMGLFVALLLLAFASVVLRWRRAPDLERRQLKTVVLAVAVGAVLIAAAPAVGGAGQALLEVVGIVVVPAGIPVAVLRYRLYEIDRIVSRTLSYTLLTGLLLGVYAATVLLLGRVLAPVSRDSDIAVAASTLLVAALFQPVRRRVQSVVDRRFNRSRYDAQRTVEDFAAGLRDEVHLDEVRERLLGAVSTTVAPVGASIWLKGGRA